MHASFIRDMFAHRRPEVLGVDCFLCVSVYVCVCVCVRSFFFCVFGGIWVCGLSIYCMPAILLHPQRSSRRRKSKKGGDDDA